LRSGWSALCVRLGPGGFWVEERGCGARGLGGGRTFEDEVEGAGGGIIKPLFLACGCLLLRYLSLSVRSSLVSMSMLSEEDGFLEGRERSIFVSLMCALVGGEESVLGRGYRYHHQEVVQLFPLSVASSSSQVASRRESRTSLNILSHMLVVANPTWTSIRQYPRHSQPP
jgi:hypothetical protein